MRLVPPLRQRLPSGLGGLLLSLVAGFSASSMAGTVELSPGPPAATTTVAPNLVLTFDDSGSMDNDYVGDYRPYEFNGKGEPSNTGWGSNSDAKSPWRCSGVIDPTNMDATDPRSWVMNGVYFNPNNTYAPPLTKDGATTLGDATYASAWNDGIAYNRPKSKDTKGGTQSLAKATFCGHTGAGYYRWNGGALATGSDGRLTSASQTALYTAANWIWIALPTNKQQDFANWYSYYRTRRMAAISAISRAFAPFGENVRVAWQNINSNSLTNSTGIYKFVDGTATANARTNFYDWLFAINASGYTPNRSAADRVGKYFTNRTGATASNPYYDQDVSKELVCRQNYHIQMTDGLWNQDSGFTAPGKDTTAISAMPDGIGTFSTSDAESKVVWNEASNSVATMADIAFHYWATDLQAGVTGGSLFAVQANRRKVPPYIADQTTSLFGTALTANADPRSNKEIYWNPANDPATWPHLVQYMIGFGAAGTLVDNDATYLSLRKGNTAWPVPATGTDDGRKIDDMWHAALNSRGKYFGVSDPAALINVLTKILNSIIARNTTAVAGTLSASVLGTSTVVYQAGYDTNDWSGTVQARRVGADGSIGTSVLWDGRALLDARAQAGDTRVILTSTGTGSGKAAAFRGSTVVDAINALDPNFGTAGGTPNGSDRLAWLRGDQSKDGKGFRQRNSVFGAVINAQALYVARPTGGYRDSWPASSPEADAATNGKSYEQFRFDHAKRAPTVYVAANDGMLHAFDATTSDTDATTVDVAPDPGRERWAYVPYSAWGRLAGWSSQNNFEFMPSVDGTPVSRDVFFSAGTTGWHTILVGGLRLGGRGVYALDISDAGASESSPGAKVLWEFQHDNLGYTYGRPNIGRLANGKWVVLVPGGYFPSTMAVDCTKAANSGNPVCNTHSSLFVLDAQSGALLKELKTPGGTTSYGLSTPVLGDYENDQVDDVAFAGDLPGNVWRYDLADVSPDNWKVELFFKPKVAGDRPVTVMPRLFSDPTSGGFMVVFGTGKYLAGEDNKIDTSTKVQAVYGIRDSGKSGQATVVDGGAATPLVAQTLTEVDSIRGLTTNPVPAASGAGTPIRGWYIELFISGAGSGSQLNKGERVVVDATALFDTNRAIITTLIPQDNDPCDPAPQGAVLLVDAATGGAAQGVSFGAIAGWPTGYAQAGALVRNPPTGGFLPAATTMGGGQIYLPGVSLKKDGSTVGFGDTYWRRRSWRSLGSGQ